MQVLSTMVTQVANIGPSGTSPSDGLESSQSDVLSLRPSDVPNQHPMDVPRGPSEDV